MQTPMNSSIPSVLQKNIQIAVQRMESSAFDDAFSTLKERFNTQMRRMDSEMVKLSADLQKFYDQMSAQVAVSPSQPSQQSVTRWDTITTASPLIHGEGENKTLKLEFDVSEYEPSEVTVKILNDILMVSARHNEKTDNSVTVKEYYREFMLPKGTDHNAVISSLSRDGVLAIEAPVPKLSQALKEKKKRSPYYNRQPSIEVYYN